MTKLAVVSVPVKPVTSMRASVVLLKPAVASFIATKVRVPKVNWAAALAAKLAGVNWVAIPAVSRVAIAPVLVKPERAVVTRNRSLPELELKSVITS